MDITTYLKKEKRGTEIENKEKKYIETRIDDKETEGKTGEKTESEEIKIEEEKMKTLETLEEEEEKLK